MIELNDDDNKTQSSATSSQKLHPHHARLRDAIKNITKKKKRIV